MRGKLPANGQYDKRPLDGVRFLVIHHSGVDVDSTAQSIALYHISLGWPGIGYHYLVHQDGTIDWCQDLDTMSYNVAGRNQEVVGVCLTGDFTHRPPRAPQIRVAKWLLSTLAVSLPQAQVRGHREVALTGYKTACPGETFLAGPRWKEGLA